MLKSFSYNQVRTVVIKWSDNTIVKLKTAAPNIIIDSILHTICERHINKKPYDDTIATYLKTQFLACGYDCNITSAKGETIRYDICL